MIAFFNLIFKYQYYLIYIVKNYIILSLMIILVGDVEVTRISMINVDYVTQHLILLRILFSITFTFNI